MLFQFLSIPTMINGPTLDFLDAEQITLISSNTDVIDEGCDHRNDWNAYVCNSMNWALLEFESLDSDSMHRSVQPVFVTSEDYPTFNNKLNSFMDHSSSGFYSG